MPRLIRCTNLYTVILWLILAVLVLGVGPVVFRDMQAQDEARERDCARRGGVLVRGQFEPVCVAAPPARK